jgi:hypothetical protein
VPFWVRPVVLQRVKPLAGHGSLPRTAAGGRMACGSVFGESGAADEVRHLDELSQHEAPGGAPCRNQTTSACPVLAKS